MNLILENCEEILLPEPSFFTQEDINGHSHCLLFKVSGLDVEANYGVDGERTYDEMKKRLETELDVVRVVYDNEEYPLLFSGVGDKMGVGVYFVDGSLYFVSGQQPTLWRTFRHEFNFADSYGFMTAIANVGKPVEQPKLKAISTARELARLNSILATHFTITDLSGAQRKIDNPYYKILNA